MAGFLRSGALDFTFIVCASTLVSEMRLARPPTYMPALISPSFVLFAIQRQLGVFDHDKYPIRFALGARQCQYALFGIHRFNLPTKWEKGTFLFGRFF